MVFVTVGTHEQPFNRLVEYMDQWAADHDEEVVMQTGFSTYEPTHCKWQKLFPYSDMREYIDKARIVITHGGPSSFIMPLQTGKIPIVVPRKEAFGEHVNDHQVDFCRKVKERQGNIIVIEEIETLSDIMDRYESITANMTNLLNSNNQAFCEKFGKLVADLFKGKNIDNRCVQRREG